MNPVRRFRLLAAALEMPKLSAVMSLMFVCLSIPILVFILLLAVAEQPEGRRTALVHFGGLDWDTRARLDALARNGP